MRRHARLVVVAGDEPPERAIADDRQAHARAHAHVPEIAAVYFGEAAQQTVALIERHAAREADGQEHVRQGVDIGQQPALRRAVKRACLARNIGGRKAQPQKTRL